MLREDLDLRETRGWTLTAGKSFTVVVAGESLKATPLLFLPLCGVGSSSVG